MKRTESALWAWIRDHNPDKDRFHFERLENLVGTGMPDVIFRLKGPDARILWIELKTGKKPKKETSKIFSKNYFNPSQVKWHKKWNSLGEKVYVLIGIDQDLTLLGTDGIEDKINDLTYRDFLRMRVKGDLYSVLELESSSFNF